MCTSQHAGESSRTHVCVLSRSIWRRGFCSLSLGTSARRMKRMEGIDVAKALVVKAASR